MRTDDEGDCGGAAVRIGFGDVESIDCEGGRAVYITGGEWASPKECGRINRTYTPVFWDASPHPRTLALQGAPATWNLPGEGSGATGFEIYALAAAGFQSGI